MEEEPSTINEMILICELSNRHCVVCLAIFLIRCTCSPFTTMAPPIPLVAALLIVSRADMDGFAMLQMPVVSDNLATDESVITVYNQLTGDQSVYEGLSGVEARFEGLFATLYDTSDLGAHCLRDYGNAKSS